MTIRPVDLQVLLPKVQEVSRTQQVQNQGEQNQQQQFAAQLKKESQHLQQQVQNTPKSLGSRITKDQSRRNKGQGDLPQGRHEQEQEKEQPKDLKDPKLGNLLDIKV